MNAYKWSEVRPGGPPYLAQMLSLCKYRCSYSTWLSLWWSRLGHVCLQSAPALHNPQISQHSPRDTHIDDKPGFDFNNTFLNRLTLFSSFWICISLIWAWRSELVAGTAPVRRGHATAALYKGRLELNAQLQSSPGTARPKTFLSDRTSKLVIK